jgi:hypothetical protein
MVQLVIDGASSLHPALVGTIKKLQTGYISGTRSVIIIINIIIGSVSSSKGGIGYATDEIRHLVQGFTKLLS